jgi:hypothetical protein
MRARPDRARTEESSMPTTGNDTAAIAEPRRRRDPVERDVEDDPAVQRWHVAKRIVWMIVLAEAFLIYYLLDKLQEALTILK